MSNLRSLVHHQPHPPKIIKSKLSLSEFASIHKIRSNFFILSFGKIYQNWSKNVHLSLLHYVRLNVYQNFDYRKCLLLVMLIYVSAMLLGTIFHSTCCEIIWIICQFILEIMLIWENCNFMFQEQFSSYIESQDFHRYGMCRHIDNNTKLSLYFHCKSISTKRNDTFSQKTPQILI